MLMLYLCEERMDFDLGFKSPLIQILKICKYGYLSYFRFTSKFILVSNYSNLFVSFYLFYNYAGFQLLSWKTKRLHWEHQFCFALIQLQSSTHQCTFWFPFSYHGGIATTRVMMLPSIPADILRVCMLYCHLEDCITLWMENPILQHFGLHYRAVRDQMGCLMQATFVTMQCNN